MIKKLIIVLILIDASFGFTLDKKIQKDESGWIGEHYDVPKYSFVALVAAAAIEGSETRFGRATWQSLDSAVMSQIITGVLKDTTNRTRPRKTDSPNDWGEGGDSFVSGHVSGMTAMVTPYILEYKDDYPLVHALWLLPAHQMIGRVYAQAHWQSDVIGGALVGFLSGYWAHKRENPMLLYFSKDNAYVGIRYKF